MSTWKIACIAAMIAAGLAPAAQADEFTKLTLVTFSGPVEIPGITLPAGTYRFSLADPETGRRVVKIADKDGKKTYGMFLSMSNQRMTPTNKPVVLFKESAAGAPPAVQVWFYPGESYGYEFAYPHDQALKIARATHQPVLAYTDRSTASATDQDRIASMKTTEVARIDENGRPVSTDEALKESTTARAQGEPPAPAPRANGPARADDAAIGTAGSPPAPAPKPTRKHLPRTGSELPLLALMGTLSLAGGVGLHLARKTL
jgi:LPXTG-motif cell wall-anchored protein